jgi:HEAT repeat protein
VYVQKLENSPDAPTDIYTLRVGGRPKNITKSALNEWDAEWSPDGRRIAFTGLPEYGDRGDVFTINADGSKRRCLTRDLVSYFAQWSPDGRRIAYIGRGLRELGFAAAVSALRDRNRTARVNAAQTLGSLRDRRAIEPLTEFYTRSTAIESRLAAVGALGQIRVKAAVPALIEALADSTPDESYGGPGAPYPVRHAAAKALRRIRTREAMDALRSSSF